MNQTFTLPASLVNDVDMLKRNLGLGNLEATIKHLLKLAVAREKKILVARLYQNRQKTLRQCAEILNVELEEMIDILNELGIPFIHDDLSQQLETANKLIKEMRAAKDRVGKTRSTASRRRRRLQNSA
jgi:predicted HTH domain antitoxin